MFCRIIINLTFAFLGLQLCSQDLSVFDRDNNKTEVNLDSISKHSMVLLLTNRYCLNCLSYTNHLTKKYKITKVTAIIETEDNYINYLRKINTIEKYTDKVTSFLFDTNYFLSKNLGIYQSPIFIINDSAKIFSLNIREVELLLKKTGE